MIKLPGKYLYHYYSQKFCSNIGKIFTDNCKENNCKITGVPDENIILNGDEIEKCLSKELNKSADRIIISSSDDNLSVFVCELSKGKRNPEVIKSKIEHTANHIVNVFKGSDFEINDLHCFYVGQYDDLYKGVLKKKSPVVKIPNFKKHNLLIKRFNCGISFEELIN